MSNSYISVCVKKMQVQVPIGLLASERTAPQPLDVDVELFASPDYLPKALAEDIMDYRVLYAEVISWEDLPHTDLLETLMQRLFACGFALPHAERMTVSLSKPTIFDKAQQAGIAGDLTRADWAKISRPA